MMGDKEFWHGIHRTLVTRNSFTDSGPTYLCRFDVDLAGNYSKAFFAGRNFNLKGACHADDCSYLFKNAISRNGMDSTSKEFVTMDRMVSIWTSFAINGHPTVDSIKFDDSWEPISPNQPFKCLNIGDELEFIDLPEAERMGVWDAIYEHHDFSLLSTLGKGVEDARN